MRTLLLSLLFATALTAGTYGQSVTISGTITDADTGEPLLSANIYNAETLKGTTSNVYGFYSLTQPGGSVPFTVSFTGYKTFRTELNLSKDTTLNVELQPVIELEEVVVSAQSPLQNIKSSEMSTIHLSPSKTEMVPALLGETDIIKTLQLMPGTQAGTEGTSGFYVRGGSPDQNLILLDGVPVYNVNHLFGFMSVFNSDAIRNVTLTKGGFPARYGGRLSSVLDIRMKEGNNKEFKGEASIGLISSKLTLEGPIVKDKTSFMVSGRRSYIDILSYPIQMKVNSESDDENYWLGYFLQDFNAKVNHIFNDKHRIYLSLYTGKDKFFMNDKYEYKEEDVWDQGYETFTYKNKDKAGLQWGNTTGALRWNYIINNRLFANFTGTISNYKFSIFEDYEEEQISNQTNEKERSDFYYEYYSQIKDYSIKADFDFFPSPAHHIRFGAQNTLHYFSPGVTVNQESYLNSEAVTDTTYGNKNLESNEFLLYAEDDITVNDILKFNIGLHYSAFNVQGQTYQSLEPRLSARVMLTDRMSVKASYSQMQQYLHLLANSSMGLPTDLWVPATKKIKPQDSWQGALGLSYSPHPDYEISLEGYYKKMNGLIDYKEGASFFELNQGNWEDLVTSGTGKSYGVELLTQKHGGTLSGWVGYTLSWANRQFEDISFGKEFPFKYDARHNLSVVSTIRFSEKTDMGVTWVYRTGYPLTIEDESYRSVFGFFREDNTQHYYSDYAEIDHFENRNNYRMPDYHRLDIGINFHKKKKRVDRTWSFGLYNAYGRNNPFMIYRDQEWDETKQQEVTRLKQLSIFNIIPYVRWSIKF
ncbi:outer membrane receptor protein involved in Fe transport [Marinilabilia salmonicolor]|uniref:TonB-dependent receptor n=1 Tax=Marinilabilia salmonicolor TaxID=989 RepID=UPI000D062282|nr:TonB-dependent receptor [Marinilabilia salmonicolor]PRZ00687.1 outer membrane receptor protein involved in Fe transport [Marinilabilia salmonicolor]